MNTDIFLWTSIVGGLLILLSYTIFLPRVEKKYLWGNMTRKMQNVFWVCIALAAISFIVGIVSIYTNASGNKVNRSLWTGLILFLLGSMLWAPMLVLNHPILVFLSLLMTTTGIWVMAVYSPYLLATICFSIVFLHASVMDNVIWYKKYVETYLSN